jgi:hypothetical protein
LGSTYGGVGRKSVRVGVLYYSTTCTIIISRVLYSNVLCTRIKARPAMTLHKYPHAPKMYQVMNRINNQVSLPWSFISSFNDDKKLRLQ